MEISETREFKILICNGCYTLQEGMCHVPECVFIRKTKDEVSEIMNDLLIRPLVDGNQLDLYPVKS